MPFSVRRDVPAKRKACDADPDISQTARRVKGMNLEALTGHSCDVASDLEGSRFSDFVSMNTAAKSRGRNAHIGL